MLDTENGQWYQQAIKYLVKCPLASLNEFAIHLGRKLQWREVWIYQQGCKRCLSSPSAVTSQLQRFIKSWLVFTFIPPNCYSHCYLTMDPSLLVSPHHSLGDTTIWVHSGSVKGVQALAIKVTLSLIAYLIKSLWLRVSIHFSFEKRWKYKVPPGEMVISPWSSIF